MMGRWFWPAVLACALVFIFNTILMKSNDAEEAKRAQNLLEVQKQIFKSSRIAQLETLPRKPEWEWGQDVNESVYIDIVADVNAVDSEEMHEQRNVSHEILHFISESTTPREGMQRATSFPTTPRWRETNTHCDSCPAFITMAVKSRQNRTTSGLRGAAKYQNSSQIFLGTIQMTANAIGNAHRCFKLFVYSDDAHIIEHSKTMGMGEQVQVRKLPDLPANVYDIYAEFRRLKGAVARMQDLKQEDVHIDQAQKEWISVSRSKLDLVKLHLDAGEKVIWIDLDTLIVADFSCFYLLPNFVIAPGFWQEKFQILNRYMPVPSRPEDHINMRERTSFVGPEYRPYSSIPSEHFVFGDIWMVDEVLYDAVLHIEQELFQKNVFASFDLQHYFSLLHYRNMTGLHDLNKETDMCWGMQFVEGNRLPWLRYPSHLGSYGGELYCTETCKKVGALSFNWASYQTMRMSPCAFFKDDTGGFSWFRNHVTRWGDSVLAHLAKKTACSGNANLNMSFDTSGDRGKEDAGGEGGLAGECIPVHRKDSNVSANA